MSDDQIQDEQISPVQSNGWLPDFNIFMTQEQINYQKKIRQRDERRQRRIQQQQKQKQITARKLEQQQKKIDFQKEIDKINRQKQQNQRKKRLLEQDQKRRKQQQIEDQKKRKKKEQDDRIERQKTQKKRKQDQQLKQIDQKYWKKFAQQHPNLNLLVQGGSYLKNGVYNTGNRFLNAGKYYFGGQQQQIQGIGKTAQGYAQLGSGQILQGAKNILSGYADQASGTIKEKAGQSMLSAALMPIGIGASALGTGYTIYKSLANSKQLKRLKQTEGKGQKLKYVIEQIGQKSKDFYDKNYKPQLQRNRQILDNATNFAGNAIKGLGVATVNRYVPSGIVNIAQTGLRRVLKNNDYEPQIFLNAQNKPLTFNDIANIDYKSNVVQIPQISNPRNQIIIEQQDQNLPNQRDIVRIQARPYSRINRRDRQIQRRQRSRNRRS